MQYLIKIMKEFSSLSYNNQFQYIKNKLLLLDLCEIQYIMFFNKLHVLFNNLPGYISKISQYNKRYIYNFSGELGDNDNYFNGTRGYIHIECAEISNNAYFVRIPLKIYKLYIHTFIDINSISLFRKYFIFIIYKKWKGVQRQHIFLIHLLICIYYQKINNYTK